MSLFDINLSHQDVSLVWAAEVAKSKNAPFSRFSIRLVGPV